MSTMSRSDCSDDFETDYVTTSRRGTLYNKSQVTSLFTSFEGKVREFIDLIDDLRRQGLSQDIDLPSAVVIGDQSSGKSSILEAISGLALPRGSGIVTRCPLEMQLKKTKEADTAWKAYLSYKDSNNKSQDHIITDPNTVEQFIRQAQNEIAGDSNGISREIITLSVEGPRCPDLTLIDLPGIARVAVEGQPEDILTQTRDLIKEFISREETVILCVIPTNTDIALNEVYTLAREADPQGFRTLGVLTKPDLVDRGTEGNILKVLNNEMFPLKNGYRIVRCRGQQEILDGLDLNGAMNLEKQFFENHRIYKKIDPRLRGTVNLAESLSDKLVDHIRKFIPKLRSEVRKQMEDTGKELKMIGVGPPKEPEGKRLYFTKTAESFVTEMTRILKNQKKISKTVVPRISDEIKTENFAVAFLWRNCFSELKQKIKNITEENFGSGDFVSEKIQHKMASYRGSELPGYVNFELFEGLIRDHVEAYEEPLFQCLEDISVDLMTIVIHVSEQLLSHIQSIKETIRDICETVHKQCKDEGRRLLLLEMRKEALVFSQDSIYLDQMRRGLESRTELNYHVYDNGNDTAEHNATVIRDLLQVYLDIANRRLSDSVPMLLRVTQHDEFISLLIEKIHEVASTENTDMLIQEDPRITLRRSEMETKQYRLEEAMKMLNKQ